MVGRKRATLAVALFAGYVAVVVADYFLQRNFWMACGDDYLLPGDPDPYLGGFSDSLLTFVISGPLLMAAVAVAKFRPHWLWVTAMIVALPTGWIICGVVSDAASTGTANCVG